MSKSDRHRASLENKVVFFSCHYRPTSEMSSIASLFPFASPFILVFLIALSMPSRASLFFLSVLLGVPLAWLLFEGFRELRNGPGAGIIGLVIMLGILCSAAAGLLSGVAVRGLLLWRPRIRQSRMLAGATVLVGGFAIPSAAAAWLWWSLGSN